MPTLNDTQRILLSHAAQRSDHSLHPLPDSQARGGTRVTKVMAQLLRAGFIEERETSLKEKVGRTDGDLRFGLFATASGLAAIGIELDEQELAVGGAPSAAVAMAVQPRPTKSAAVVALMQREQGATLAELIAATGWLPHTTRAALTGLRKKGHAIAKGKRDGTTCYRIGAPA